MRSWRAEALHWFKLDSDGPAYLPFAAGVAIAAAAFTAAGLGMICATRAVATVVDDTGKGEGEAMTVAAGERDTKGDGVAAGELCGCGDGGGDARLGSKPDCADAT
ncbi:MAG: hypothetical protein WCC84_01105, partial [Candidatus Cybelea sp.]